jgi:6,7-dimethyl-8-ribityllumazine synthase
MATINLSHINGTIPDGKKMRFGIVVSDWNEEITGALLEGTVNTLKKSGVKDDNINIIHVPGAFELTLGGQWMAEYDDELDGVICLGCVIQGETPHFTYICQSVSQGLTQLNLEYNIPFIFGVLTVDSLSQAKERSGGKLGNKGDEAAITAIRMAALQSKLEE